MNDKMKALVEAARAMNAHIDRHWLDHGQVTNFHSKVLRAALDALDAEPESVGRWRDMQGEQVMSGVFPTPLRWELLVYESPARGFFRWHAAPEFPRAQHGVAQSLELAQAAAVRAAQGES